MTRKVLWVAWNRMPNDDRDAYPNKRIDIPGFLLADLFRKTFTSRMVKDIRASLGKEIHAGSWRANNNFEEIVNINNIQKIIKSTILDVNLKSSMATGNFGSLKIGGAAKIGVSQVLNRLNYMSAISHLRRISTPIEKTGKLIAPRKLHNTQYGLVCLTKDTDVILANGINTKKIGVMTNDDNVLTINDSSLKEEPSSIHSYFKTTPSKVLKITTLSGRTIKCSPEHPILVDCDEIRKWTNAGELKINDNLIVKNYSEPVSTSNGTLLSLNITAIENAPDNHISELSSIGLNNITLSIEKMEPHKP
jgi:hypothetical protein